MIRPFAGKLALAAGVAICISFLASPASAGGAPAPSVIPDSALHAVSSTVGGAKPQPTTRTVTHFFRTAVNPLAGTTFGFNMAGQAASIAQRDRPVLRLGGCHRQLPRPAAGHK